MVTAIILPSPLYNNSPFSSYAKIKIVYMCTVVSKLFE